LDGITISLPIKSNGRVSYPGILAPRYLKLVRPIPSTSPVNTYIADYPREVIIHRYHYDVVRVFRMNSEVRPTLIR